MTNIKLTSIQFEMLKELGKKNRPSPLKPDLMAGKLIEQFYLTRIYGNFDCDKFININKIQNSMTLMKKKLQFFKANEQQNMLSVFAKLAK